MTAILKDLAVDQRALEFSQVEIEAAYEPAENVTSAVKYLAPKSYAVKAENDKRKEMQMTHKLWMQTIFQKRMDLQQTKLKLKYISANQNNR